MLRARTGRAAMRMLGALSAAAVVATCLGPALAYGQQIEQRPPAEEQFEPYHTHHDTRQGHDHDYPDRGSIVREAPQGATVVSYAGLSYRFRDGVWYEPRGPAFMVVEPPIGLVVPTLPTFSTVLAHGGDLYLYCNNVYYQPRPDLGGYEVVNDPAEAPPKARAASNVGASPAGAVAAPAAVASVPAGTAPAVAPTAMIPAAAPAAARVAAAPGPQIESDVPTPATVVPYTVPSATPVPAASAGLRVAAARMTPDPAPVAPTYSAALGAPGAAAAVPASAAYIAAPTAGMVAAGTATLAPGAPATASVTPAPAAPVAPTTVAAATPNIAPAAAVATVPVVTAPTVAAVPMPSAAAPNLPAAAAIPAVATAPVTLPASYSSASPPPPPKGVRADVLPRNGQSQEQLAKDRYECYQFAVKQSGYDPIHSGSAALQQQQYDYDRAQAGCFDARGYSVR
jgi:hypothetical protein